MAYDPTPDRGAPIRVLIVDDSIVARTVFRTMLSERGFDVCGVARGAEAALALLADITVDAILLDLEMPGIDGLTALPQVLAAGRGARVVVVSSACADGAGGAVRALALGASDTMLKPSAGELGEDFAAGLCDRIRRLCRTRPPRTSRVTALPVPPHAGQPSAPRHDPIACIAIGASTGGLLALTTLFEGLSTRCTAPILVTQHLPAEFMPYFADQLSEIAGRPASVAVAGQRLEPEQLVVAPGHAHLTLVRDGTIARVAFDHEAAPCGCQPAVDPMLAAVADIFGSGGIGVVLSGMGRDGVVGAAQLSAAGGELLVQDAASATIWGMPGAVVRAGLADAVLPPAAIGQRITARAAAATGATAIAAHATGGMRAWK